MAQTERRLNCFRSRGTDCQPRRRSLWKSRRKGDLLWNLRRDDFKLLRAAMQINHPDEDETGNPQCQKMRHQQQQRRCIILIDGLNHGLNLRPRRAGSIQIWRRLKYAVRVFRNRRIPATGLVVFGRKPGLVFRLSPFKLPACRLTLNLSHAKNWKTGSKPGSSPFIASHNCSTGYTSGASRPGTR